MQDAPTYDDVVQEVRTYLDVRAHAARQAGVAEIWIDPGIGFGKTLEHNLALVRAFSLPGEVPVVGPLRADPVDLGVERRGPRLDGDPRVIVEGLQKAKPGMKVRAVPVKQD